jgi:hypothetical protein
MPNAKAFESGFFQANFRYDRDRLYEDASIRAASYRSVDGNGVDIIHFHNARALTDDSFCEHATGQPLPSNARLLLLADTDFPASGGATVEDFVKHSICAVPGQSADRNGVLSWSADRAYDDIKYPHNAWRAAATALFGN